MTRGRSLHFPARPASPVRRSPGGPRVAADAREAAGVGEGPPARVAPASAEAQARAPSQVSQAMASGAMAGAHLGMRPERSRGGPGVYLQDPPLQFSIPGATGVMYDEALSMLLVTSHSRVRGPDHALATRVHVTVSWMHLLCPGRFSPLLLSHLACCLSIPYS